MKIFILPMIMVLVIYYAKMELQIAKNVYIMKKIIISDAIYVKKAIFYQWMKINAFQRKK